MQQVQLMIRELRRRKGMTQRQLADRLGVTFQTISKWETADSYPDIMALPEIAEVFQVTVDQLLGLQPLEEARFVFWNEDYLAFLVRQMWKITGYKA